MGLRVTNRKAHARGPKAERKKEELLEMEKLQKILQNGIDFAQPPTKFTELPLSGRTIKGLESGHFIEMTDIQRCALPIALTGLDVMGAAKTGSGKTLTFLIPVLERLFLQKWTVHDGLGALILSPTRELALQTFDVLRKLGKYHTLSAGLVIGGNDLKSERDAIARMNVLVATPGRLLQHMDQTCAFEWSQLQIIVLDEADRILDLGFAKTIDAILSELPLDRQTMLFSATQTDSVTALARLTLKDPVEISVHAQQESATPDKLQQKYLICPLSEKIDRVYSFIKSNIKSKTLIFLSSCKQVRFFYEAFSRLQPGVPLMHLHGRQKQSKRLTIFYDFCRKQHAVLFATDVAARGLDFPAIDWVVQADCPEDVDTYIHRVGRTARFDKAGNALLLVLPSETTMVDLLKAKKVPLTPMYAEDRPLPPPKRSAQSQLQALCSQEPEIKYLGQKALVSYVRSVFLHGNKDVFKVHELPVDLFARSLGLASTPKLRFVAKPAAKNASRQLAAMQSRQNDGSTTDSDFESVDDDEAGKKPVNKIDKIFRRKNLDVLSDHYSKLRDEPQANVSEDEKDEEFLTVKRRNHEIGTGEGVSQPSSTLSRRQQLKSKKKHLLKQPLSNKHLLFNENGESHELFPYETEDSFDRSATQKLAEKYISAGQSQMRLADSEDTARQRQALRANRTERKRKMKEASRAAQSGPTARVKVAIAGCDSDSPYESSASEE